MTQFRIRDLLTLVLISGVLLVWLSRSNDGVPASALLQAKKASASLPPANLFAGLPPLTDDELIEALGLNDWAEVEAFRLTESPFSVYRGKEIPVDAPWLDTPVSFYWEMDPDDPKQAINVIWNADWEAIEQRNISTKRTSTIRVVFTGIAVIFLGWLYWPSKRKIAQADIPQAMV